MLISRWWCYNISGSAMAEGWVPGTHVYCTARLASGQSAGSQVQKDHAKHQCAEADRCTGSGHSERDCESGAPGEHGPNHRHTQPLGMDTAYRARTG